MEKFRRDIASRITKNKHHFIVVAFEKSDYADIRHDIEYLAFYRAA